MNFKPQNFRSLPLEAPKLRNDAGMTLILVKASGEACYAHGRTDKDQLVSRYEPASDMLLCAWTGCYKTDVFLLSINDIETHYR
jgi:hypothetical protein